MPYTEIKKSIFYEFFKRFTDIVFSLILLIFFTPINILVAIAIKLDSPGPILADTPERVGKNGKLFKMYKFRSMVQNAHLLLTEDPEFAKLYEQYKKGSYKLKNDPRITRVGRFIRKHSLDEVPQLINVIKGDMSLVGPRAYYPDELREQQKKYPATKDAVKIVLSVKPGITGYWQVSGRSEINFDKRIEMDADYVKKRSILYDLYIIARTPWAMITGRGAL
ncbi:MAG: multidrug MFS transporter [Candidatus Dojkabacteria bacterium]|nr:MAG: multidrug MFS transporter [Candidatus Dojkabacteria bacterium]GIW61573.1 MAG: multidrug MFS transporter [Patescibacteria group bacterium]